MLTVSTILTNVVIVGVIVVVVSVTVTVVEVYTMVVAVTTFTFVVIGFGTLKHWHTCSATSLDRRANRAASGTALSSRRLFRTISLFFMAGVVHIVVVTVVAAGVTTLTEVVVCVIVDVLTPNKLLFSQEFN